MTNIIITLTDNGILLLNCSEKIFYVLQMFAPFKRRSLAAGLGVAMGGTCSLYLKYKRLKFLNENAKDALVMVVCY